MDRGTSGERCIEEHARLMSSTSRRSGADTRRKISQHFQAGQRRDDFLSTSTALDRVGVYEHAGSKYPSSPAKPDLLAEHVILSYALTFISICTHLRNTQPGQDN